MRKDAGDKALADATRAGDQHVKLLFDPGEGRQRCDQLRIDATRRARVEIFERRALRQFRLA